MMPRGHNSITAAWRATHHWVNERLCPGASFGLNTCPNAPINSSMRLEGISVRGLESAQQQHSLCMR
jgi:hypothetical protein